jgi:hypothetical protein
MDRENRDPRTSVNARRARFVAYFAHDLRYVFFIDKCHVLRIETRASSTWQILPRVALWVKYGLQAGCANVKGLLRRFASLTYWTACFVGMTIELVEDIKSVVE